jgi:cobalt/nickel transport system ATP-binding protein
MNLRVCKQPKGKIVAILGPNGADKSTLFLHFNGILRPSFGKILVDEKPISYEKKELMRIRQKNLLSTLVGVRRKEWL